MSNQDNMRDISFLIVTKKKYTLSWDLTHATFILKTMSLPRHMSYQLHTGDFIFNI